MLLILKGRVNYSHDPDDRDENPEYHGISPTTDVTIGGVDVMAQVMKHMKNYTGKATCTIMKKEFTGDLYFSDNDPGYSEVTPGSAASLTVGPHNIFDMLEKYSGQEITFMLSDGPQNIIAIQMGDYSQ